MSTSWLWNLGHVPGWLLLALHVALQVFFIGRALLRPHREPASRLAWVLVILVAPVFGMLAYVLFGEANIGRRRIARMQKALARLPSFAAIGRHEAEADAEIARRHLPLFRVGQSISGFPAVGGNSGKLLGDSDDVIDHMVADIDAARENVARRLLHLARRHQRSQGGRGAEARGGARRRPAGRWPTTSARAPWCARRTGRTWTRPASGWR